MSDPSAPPSPSQIRSGGVWHTEPQSGVSGSRLAAGDAIGRYVLLECLGRGGMGEVHRAYDPQLRRELAVKILATAKATPALEARLVREAQALARLRDPHIVTVYDVGRAASRVYLTMELVDGEPLRAWLERRPPARAILEAFVVIGRALSAAHAAGVIHRDVKPDNVMRAHDGRIVVLDFGLARQSGEGGVGAAPEASDATGAGWAGTPRYMAPEQFDRGEVTPATDQFGFCVSLYEALYASYPFAGERPADIAEAVRAHRLREPRAAAGVSRRVRAAISRGLALDPADRFASMGALVAELERAVRSRRRRMASLGLVTAAGAAATIAVLAAQGPEPSVCAGAERQLESVWDEARRRAIAARFADAGAPGAAPVVTAALDGYARDWIAARTDACEATWTRREQSEALLDLRMACLDERRAAFGALIGTLAADPLAPAEVAAAITAAADLPALTTCAHAAALRAGEAATVPAEIAAEVARLEAELERGRTAYRLARYGDARTTAEAVAAAARTLETPRLRASATRLVGDARAALGEYAEAAAAYRDALPDAAAAGDPGGELQLLTRLMRVLGEDLGRFDEALLAADLARAALVRAGDEALARAELDFQLGTMLRSRGDLPGARQRLERALRVRADALGEEHLAVADAANNLAIVLEDQGHFDDALALFDRAAGIHRRLLGADHPMTAEPLFNAGLALKQLGRYDEALERYRAAQAIWEATFGADHPHVSQALNNIGSVQLALRRFDEAEASYRRALAIAEARFGADHPRAAQPLMNLGAVELERDRPAAAEPHLRRALAIQEQALGGGHTEVGIVVANLGDVARRQGRGAEAERHFARALAIFEGALGDRHPLVGYPLLGLGEVYLERGDRARARTVLRRARALWAAGVEPNAAKSLHEALERAGLTGEST